MNEAEMMSRLKKQHRGEEQVRKALGTRPGYEAAWYPSPINLPEARSGKIQVKHRTIVGREPVVNYRQAVLRGATPCFADVKPEAPLKIHQLLGDKNGVWMTDRPEELNQIHEMLFHVRPRGRICVGGLGLGILPKTLMELSKLVRITEVVVVEIDADVIKLCEDKSAGYTVVHDDIKHYLETHDKAFDCYLLDTWQGTNEMSYWGNVFPLRRIIRNRFGTHPKVWCWAEDIMWGQVMTALLNRCGHWMYANLKNMTPKKALWFLENVGSEKWEQLYGDKMVKEEHKEDD